MWTTERWAQQLLFLEGCKNVTFIFLLLIMLPSKVIRNCYTFPFFLLEEQDKKLEHANNIVQEKQAIIDDLHEQKTEEENKSAVL